MLDVISDFLMNHPRKSPLRDGKMRQGLGKLNPQNLDALLAADEITQEQYDEAVKALKGKESKA